MPNTLVIDTPGGSDFAGHSLRNVGRLHVGGPGLPTAGYAFQVTGNALFDGDVTITGDANISSTTLTLPFTQITGQIANAQVPAGAVTQHQAALSIGVAQITPGNFASGNWLLYNAGNQVIAGGDVGGFYFAAGGTASALPIYIGSSSTPSIAFNGTFFNFNGAITATSVASNSTIVLASGQGLYLDGGVNTYLVEAAADRIDVVTGGTPSFHFRLSGANYSRLPLLPYSAADTLGTDSTRWSTIYGGAGSFSGTVTVQGSSGGFVVSDRVAGTAWSVYATGGSFYLIANAVGQAMAVDGTTRAVTFAQNVHAVGFVMHGGSFYLDGGGDTYMQEGAANDVFLYAGGSARMRWNASYNWSYQSLIPSGDNAQALGLSGNRWTSVHAYTGAFNRMYIASGEGLYFDGLSDTYIVESAANRLDFVTGGVTRMRLQSGDSRFYDALTAPTFYKA